MNGTRRAVATAALLGALVPQWWMRPGAVVAAGDTGLPLFNMRGITALWGDQFAGTGSTGYPSAMLLERGLVRAVHLLGGSPSTGQRLWFTLVVAVAAASVAWMAAAFVRHPAAVATAGVAAVINPFHLHSLPNMLPLVCLGCMAIAVGACARWWLGRSVSPLVGVVLGVWAAELARNPPLFVLFAAVAGSSVVAVLVACRQRRAVAATIAWFAAASLFWLVPLMLHFLGGTAGLEVVAETGSDWDWTQRHSGPAAVVTFTAAWVWGDADVLTATAHLSQGVWLWLRWALPLLVVASFIVARRRRVVRWLAALWAALVVLSVGVNAPFGPINRLLTDTVPGFWLFRQPASKFGVPLLLCTALVLAIGVDSFLAQQPSPATRRSRPVLLALALAALAFCHPLLTGSVIPGDRSYLPSSEVRIPDSLLDAGRMIDEAPGFGATLVLPLSEYYQRGTVWGYYGVDDAISRVSRRPAVFLLPEGYYEPAGAAPELMKVAEAALRVGDRRAFTGAMKALGTSVLAVRLDVTPAYGRNRRFINPAELDAAARTMGLPVIGATETVRVYSVPSAARFSAADAAWSVVAPDGYDPDEARATAAAVTSGSVVLEQQGAPAVAWVPRPDDTAVEVALPAGSAAAMAVIQAPLIWRVASTEAGVTVRLASSAYVAGTEVFGPDTVPTVSVASPVDASLEAAAVIVGDEMLAVRDDTLLQAQGGEELHVLAEPRPEPIDFAAVTATDCKLDDASVPPVVDVAGGVRLAADATHPCVEVVAGLDEPPTNGQVWHLRARFRASDEEAASVCWWLPALGRCAPGTDLRPSGTSGSIDVLTDVRYVDVAGAQLVLSAQHDGSSSSQRTLVTWSEVSIQPLVPLAKPLVLPQPMASWTTVAAGPVTTLEVADSVAAMLGKVRPEVGDCNDYDDQPTELSVVAGAPPDEPGGEAIEVTLRANRHSACIWMPINRAVSIGSVELAFRYRSGSDSAARYALVDDVTGETMLTASLPAAHGWTNVEVALELAPVLSSRSGRARLYLYADGPGPGEPTAFVTTEYTAIRLSPRPPISLVVVAGERPFVDNPTAVTDIGPRRAAIATGSDEVTVVFHQAYAPGWSLSGLPQGASARHVLADGWANGWVVDGLDGRQATIEVSYRWEHFVAAAVWSVVPVVVAGVIVALLLVLRRRRESATE